MIVHSKVLDHGYVEIIQAWGSDQAIVEAARMSTQKGFEGWGTDDKPGDEKLLRYLWTHRHTTPFEMAGLTIEVQAPIFVVREWQRHRTQSYSEASARYAPLPDVNYVPSVERLMVNAGGTNKQAGTIKGADALTPETAEMFREAIRRSYVAQEDTYRQAMDEGVPKELARLVLPVGRYTRMRASANLRNWLSFLTLRLDESAQLEIREYAIAVGRFVEEMFPRTWALFSESRES